MSAQAGPAGYDTARVEAWIAKHVDALRPPLRWRRLEGGHSNLTYLLEDADEQVAVIRRPPLGELLPKAHDMHREFSVISALAPTAVPVPHPLGFCDDLDVTGAQFYVMEFIEGHPLYNANDTRAYVAEPSRTALAHNFIDVLAALHEVEPDAVGLGDLGKRENYVGRQVSTWYRSWIASAGPAQYDDPRAHAIHDFLLAHLPDQGPARVVHGDYSPHNCLVLDDGTIAAVLDWEICTLGDPLADLAYALNPWPESGERVRAESAMSVPGFPPRSELASRYAARTGRDLSGLDYYVAFNRWKSAAIVHGVYARYMEGKKGTEGVQLDELRQSIDYSLALAESAVDRLDG
ncbi:MAG TPA: phosphotransferase family protein [Dehalococcoidia bacterium]|nr:phosphotransferase family protein [Dehalococcoidia bacterium]